MAEVLKVTYTGAFSPRDYITFRTRIYQVTQSIENASSYLRIEVTLLCSNGASYYLNSYGSIAVKLGSTTLASASGSAVIFDFRSYTSKVVLNKYITVAHDTDGTYSETYTTVCDYGSYSTGTDSGTVTLDTIPRGSVLGTIANFNLEDTFKVPVTKYSEAFTDTLVIKFGDRTIKTIADYKNNADITLTNTELLTAYNTIEKTAIFTFELTTKNSDATVGTHSQTATGTIAGTIKIGTGVNKRGFIYIGTESGNKKGIVILGTEGGNKRGIG